MLDLKHTNLANTRLGWYTPNPSSGPVPAEQLLVVGLDMAAAKVPRHPGSEAPRLHAYVEQGAVALAPRDRERIMAELRMRHGRSL